MRSIRTAGIVFAALLSVPAMGAAAQSTKPAKPAMAAAHTEKAAAVPSHSTKGVVKSVDATSLVIAGPGGKGKETTFVLNPTTQKEGDVATGANVTVRYRDEAKQHVATAIMVAPAKVAAKKK